MPTETVRVPTDMPSTGLEINDNLVLGAKRHTRGKTASANTREKLTLSKAIIVSLVTKWHIEVKPAWYQL